MTHALAVAWFIISACVAESGLSPLTVLACLLITGGCFLAAGALWRMERNERSAQVVEDATREEVQL
jgi:uncharacterized membrane protein YidH (DUF202 family)